MSESLENNSTMSEEFTSSRTQHTECSEDAEEFSRQPLPKRAKQSTLVLVAGKNLTMLVIILLFSQVSAWGSSNNGDIDYSVYGNGFTYDWLYDGSTLSFQVLGCVWGMVEDSEEAGCLEDESEDGTYNWYMMANCRRPQVAYSVYSSSGCSSSNFVGSVR
jgi:hypothetical protein